MWKFHSVEFLLDVSCALLKKPCLTPLILLVLALPALATEKPCSLVRNGGFDSPAAWEATAPRDDRQMVPLVGSDYSGMVKEPLRIPPATIVDGGNPGKCMGVEGPGVASQDFPAPVASGGPWTAAVDVWVNGVSAQPSHGGYAYAAVCQTDAGGRVVAQDELVRVAGSHPWQRHSCTFRLRSNTEFISLRCGLSQAGGEARFDNWTLVPGEQAKRLDEVQQPRLRPDYAGGTVAILHEPKMTIQGAASAATTIAEILGRIGVRAHLVSAEQLADTAFLNLSRFDLLVLPTGRTFPAKARLALIGFLHQGGNLITLGGYALNNQLRNIDGSWVPEKKPQPLNTATGNPQDGMELSREQIGMFDASFPLRRARLLQTAEGQRVVDAKIDQEGRFDGWAASGVIGYDQSRWIPLLSTFDRYHRPRGAAAALMLNYKGFYKGSGWAYFGVENIDLLATPDAPMASVIQEVTKFLLRNIFLHNLATSYRLYDPGECVKASVIVDNQGRQARNIHVRFSVLEAGSTLALATADREVAVAEGTSRLVDVALPAFQASADLYRITATLSLDGRVIDEIISGFVVRKPAILQAMPQLRFSNNYFTLAGRPLFLFGADNWQSFFAAGENPWTWSEELRAARDIGLTLYEDLNYVRSGYQMTDGDWRSFLAMGQLAHKHGLVFMPGMLILQNVAVADEVRMRQSNVCREYAKRFHEFPGILYYVNGDYHFEPSPQVKLLWNDWLKRRYQTTDRLRKAWGAAALSGELGAIAFPPPKSDRWDDGATLDEGRFEIWLTNRWNGTHVDAVRQYDPHHPITAEFYQLSLGAVDLPSTISSLDVANVGFFMPPGEEDEQLPLCLRFNDLRARGKGVCLGEYGVKTHPAWSREKGALGYQIARTEQEQARLFLAVGHRALGMGAAKVQNWSLYDPAAQVFPWGMLHPNQLIPKEIAYVHRNQSLVWRHFRPKYLAPPLTVCLPNQLRLGNGAALGQKVICQAFADLLALHYDFNCLDDDHLERLSSSATKVLVYPSPAALLDETYVKLRDWVRDGGTLLLTGDFSYDANRQRTRVARLEELAGAKSLAINYHGLQREKGQSQPAEFLLPLLKPQNVRPAIRVQATTAEVLGKTAAGEPVLLRNRVGRGTVYFFTDPAELSEGARDLYAAVLQASGMKPLSIEPAEPWLHVMAQATAPGGTIHIVFNKRTGKGVQNVCLRTAAGPVHLNARNGWPAMAAVTQDGKVVALTTDGEATVGGDPVVVGAGLKMLLSLDGNDLRRSAAVLAGPCESGRLGLPSRPGKFQFVVGDFQGGRWLSRERCEPQEQNGVRWLDLDGDRATCLTVMCRAEEEPRWREYLTRVMLHPEQALSY